MILISKALRETHFKNTRKAQVRSIVHTFEIGRAIEVAFTSCDSVTITITLTGSTFDLWRALWRVEWVAYPCSRQTLQWWWRSRSVWMSHKFYCSGFLAYLTKIKRAYVIYCHWCPWLHCHSLWAALVSTVLKIATLNFQDKITYIPYKSVLHFTENCYIVFD